MILDWLFNLFRRKKKKIIEKLIDHDLQSRINEVGTNSYIRKLDLSVEIRLTCGLGNLDSTKEMQKQLKFARMSKEILDNSITIKGTKLYVGKVVDIFESFDNIIPLKSYDGNLVEKDINWIIDIRQQLKDREVKDRDINLFHVTGIDYRYDDFNISRFFKLIGPLNVITVRRTWSDKYTYNDIKIPSLPSFNYPSLVKLEGQVVTPNELWIAYKKDEYILFKCINNEYVILFIREEEKEEEENGNKSIVEKYV